MNIGNPKLTIHRSNEESQALSSRYPKTMMTPSSSKATSSWQIKLCWIGCYCISLIESVSVNQQYMPFGFQTQSDDSDEAYSSYAVDMVYNNVSHEITITGGTYSNYFNRGQNQNSINNNNNNSNNLDGSSDCFVAILHLPHQVMTPKTNQSSSSSSNSMTRNASWVRRRQIGNPSMNEFCSAIHSKEGRYEGIIAVGHSNAGGILHPLLPYGSTHRAIYGMMLDFDDSIDLRGGELLHSNVVQYPVAITSDATTGDIYVAEIISDLNGTSINQQMDLFFDKHIYSGGSDLSATSYTFPMLGDAFAVGIKKFTQKESNLTDQTTSFEGGEISRTFQSGWSRQFGTIGNNDNVQISGLVHVSPSVMLLTGYTKGEGNAFGTRSNSNENDLDGFLTLIDPESGNVIHSKRIQSTFMSGNDRILGICRSDDIDSSLVYLVGATDGVFDTTYLGKETDDDGSDGLSRRMLQNDAFLIKFDLNGMEIVWARQIEGMFPPWMESNVATGPQVHGTSCAVTHDGENVYMGGNVKNWASLSMQNHAATDEFTSAGGDDIFVVKFRADDGEFVFAHQIGSDEDDTLANGRGLTTDSSGNLILLGNTRGSFYRGKTTRNRISDIFAMSMDGETGEYVATFNQQPKKGQSDNKAGDRLEHSDGGIFSGSFFNDEWWARYDNAIFALGTLLGGSLILIGVALILRHRRIQEKRRKQLQDYLRWLDDLSGYDDEPVTIQETPSGGWKITHQEDIMKGCITGARNPRTHNLYADSLLDSSPSTFTDDITDDEESVITKIGRSSMQRGHNNVDSRSSSSTSRRTSEQNLFSRDSPMLLDPKWDNSGRRGERSTRNEQKKAAKDPYDEIRDLISTASRRVPSKSTTKTKSDPRREVSSLKSSKKKPRRSRKGRGDNIDNAEYA